MYSVQCIDLLNHIDSRRHESKQSLATLYFHRAFVVCIHSTINNLRSQRYNRLNLAADMVAHRLLHLYHLLNAYTVVFENGIAQSVDAQIEYPKMNTNHLFCFCFHEEKKSREKWKFFNKKITNVY